MNRLLPLLAFAASALPGPASASDRPRGPASLRDAHLVAQPRLTLPAASTFTVEPGRVAFEVSSTVANSFSWTQDEAGEAPGDRRFLVDGEAVILDLTVRRGLAENVDAAVRVPLHNRGGGFLDGFIDWWHRVFDVPDGDRPLFVKDAFRFEGQTTDGGGFSWNDETGAGLGDVEIETRYRVVGGNRGAPSLAVVARVSLPTGTGPFSGNGFGAGSQLVGHVPLARRLDLHSGLGFTVQETGPVRGVSYSPLRGHAFAAIEWRPWRTVSLVAETNAATRLAANVASYPGLHWILNVTGRIDLSDEVRLDLGFTENFKSQLTTTDFALYLGLAVRP